MSTALDHDIDVDLDIDSDDRPECIVHPGAEAVIEGLLESVPCGHPQYLCLRCYDRNLPVWRPGDRCWCYTCAKRDDNYGWFTGWGKI